MVERLPVKQWVGGSSPPVAARPVAQWLEQGPYKPKVAGSIPAGPTRRFMMYYMLERFAFPYWISMGIILQGDFRKHMVVLETFRNLHPETDFRAKRISDKAAMIFAARGMTIMTAPDVLKNV